MSNINTANTNLSALATSVYDSTRSISELQQQLTRLNSQRAASTSIREIGRLGLAVSDVRAEMRTLQHLPPPSFTDRIRQAGAALWQLTNVTKGIDVFKFGVGAVKSIANLGIEAEQTQLKFETLMGDTGKAKTLLADIRGFANITPFDNAGIQQNAESLLNFGVAQDKIMPILKLMGDVSGGSQEKLNAMTSAFTEVSSAGRLTGQSLNQMISSGFNPLKVIAENSGISMDQLKSKMESGAISVKMVEEAMRLATGPGGDFHESMQKMSQSAGGLLANAMDRITSKLADLGQKYLVPIIAQIGTFANTFISAFENAGDILQPFFDTLIPLWDALTGFLGSFFTLGDQTDTTSSTIDFFLGLLGFISPVLTVITNGISGLITILTPLVPLIAGIAAGWGLLNITMGISNLLMETSPIYLIIGAIVILIGVITTVWNKFEGFRAVVMGAWETLQGFATMMKDYVINRFKELLSGITGIGSALLAFFSGDFKKAWEIGKNAVSDLSGVNSAEQAINDGISAVKGYKRGYDSELLRTKLAKATAAGDNLMGKQDLPKPKQASSSAFDDLKKGDRLKQPGKAKSTTDGIIGGGSKTNNITINLAKMQDQIVINTVNAGEGAQKLRQILEEELNRLLGSVSQMQAS